MSSPCTACSGQGYVIAAPCGSCSGTGKERTEATVEIEIPAGVDHGMQMRLRGEGDAADSMFVLGAVYTGKAKPQVKSAKEKNAIKQIMTKEKHKLIFDDTPGKGKITVITGDEKVKIELDVKESSVKVHSEKLVYIETKDAQIKASGSVEVECKDADVKASGTVTIKGSQKASIIVGGNKVELSAGGVVIKGSMVKIN